MDQSAPGLHRSPRNKMVPSTMDKLPPHSIEAEQGVIGCILLCATDCLPECIEKHVCSEVFYDLRHRALWNTCLELYEDNVNIDIITLQQRLKDKQQLDGIGGLAYLASLPDVVPSAANIQEYIAIVMEKYGLRKIIASATNAISQAYEFTPSDGNSIIGLADRLERDIHSIIDSGGRPEKTIKDLVNASISIIESFHNNAGKIIGVPTGFPDIDHEMCGLKAGQVVVLAARPSMGKTSLAMQIAEQTAIDHNTQVAVFSLEMTAESLVTRTLCSRARANLRTIQREGEITQANMQSLTTAAAKLAKANLHIDETSSLSVEEFRSRLRRWVTQYGIKFAVIDYLQLMTTLKKCENRQQEITFISGAIKGAAKELKIPILVLAQLNREIEKRKGRPQKSDLRESGSIEQDADDLWFLWKPERDADKKDDAEPDCVPTNLYVGKSRNGKAEFDIPLLFNKPFTRFESVARFDHEN